MSRVIGSTRIGSTRIGSTPKSKQKPEKIIQEAAKKISEAKKMSPVQLEETIKTTARQIASVNQIKTNQIEKIEEAIKIELNKIIISKKKMANANLRKEEARIETEQNSMAAAETMEQVTKEAAAEAEASAAEAERQRREMLFAKPFELKKYVASEYSEPSHESAFAASDYSEPSHESAFAASDYSEPSHESAFAASAFEAPESISMEEAEMECILETTPDNSIINMINSVLGYFNLPRLTESPELSTDNLLDINISRHAVLLNSCHGGLPVIKTRNKAWDRYNPDSPEFTYNYKMVESRSKLRRLIKSPSTCCSFIRPDIRQNYLSSVIKIISNSASNSARPGTDYNVIIDKIKAKLIELSPDLKIDQIPKCKRTTSGSQSICVNRDRAFEYVETPRKSTIINKIFATDEYHEDFETNPEHPLAPRGMLFCNDVNITVNNSWVSGIIENDDFDKIIKKDGKDGRVKRGYEIGVYNKGPGSKGTITYRTKTNLLSCPYFMFFASQRLGSLIITPNISLSLGWENNTRLIPMVTRITAEVLYWYFLNQPFLFIDMSCESLCYRDETNLGAEYTIIEKDARRELRSTAAYKSQLAALQNILQNGEYRLRGGNRKTRCNQKI
jgi:hypothetical protein